MLIRHKGCGADRRRPRRLRALRRPARARATPTPSYRRPAPRPSGARPRRAVRSRFAVAWTSSSPTSSAPCAKPSASSPRARSPPTPPSWDRTILLPDRDVRQLGELGRWASVSPRSTAVSAPARSPRRSSSRSSPGSTLGRRHGRGRARSRRAGPPFRTEEQKAWSPRSAPGEPRRVRQHRTRGRAPTSRPPSTTAGGRTATGSSTARRRSPPTPATSRAASFTARTAADGGTPGLGLHRPQRHARLRTPQSPTENSVGTPPTPASPRRLPGAADRVLGPPGKGAGFFSTPLDGGRVGIAAMSVGLAQGALEQATAYAKERVAFGAPIARYQAIYAKLAELKAQIEAARLLTYRAALKEAGNPSRRRRRKRSSSPPGRGPRRRGEPANPRRLRLHRGVRPCRFYRDAKILPSARAPTRSAIW